MNLFWGLIALVVMVALALWPSAEDREVVARFERRMIDAIDRNKAIEMLSTLEDFNSLSADKKEEAIRAAVPLLRERGYGAKA